MQIENAHLGYSHDELEAAFERVQNQDHWKGPIDRVVDVDLKDAGELRLIQAAVEYFTATTPTFHLALMDDGTVQTRVKALGYWAGPAA